MHLGDTIEVKDGPLRYMRGVIIGRHGDTVRVEFGDGCYLSYDRPGRLVVRIIDGEAQEKGFKVTGTGASAVHSFHFSELWLVSKRPDGPDW